MSDFELHSIDVVVLGTGAVNSIVAAAISRTGLKVLHLDHLDFYGDQDATLTLKHFCELNHEAVHVASEGDCPVATPLAVGSISSEEQALPPGCALLAINEKDVVQSIQFHGRQQMPADVVAAARRISIDLQPRLTLARGFMTDTFVSSGVANYIDFKSLEALFVAEPVGDPPSMWCLKRVSGSCCLALIVTTPFTTAQVPASKGDVFTSPELSLLDKRQLMKFLQFANDWHVAYASTDGSHNDGGAHTELAASSGGGSGHPSPAPAAAPAPASAPLSLNEHQLGMGRSLLRAQNKAVTSYDYASYANAPFESFLAGPCGLGPTLRRLVLHALALLPTTDAASADGSGIDISAAEGMRRLTRHLAALGRFGETAFLIPMYGSGEVAQAFCRTAAVAGATYMLRTAPDGVVLAAPDAAEAAYAALAPVKSAADPATPEQATDMATSASIDGRKEARDGDVTVLSFSTSSSTSSSAQAVIALRLPGHGLIRTRAVVSTPSYVPGRWRTVAAHSSPTIIARAACIIDRSISLEGCNALVASAPGAPLIAVVVPPGTPPLCHKYSVYAVQCSARSTSSPTSSINILYVWTNTEATGDRERENAVQVLQRAVNLLVRPCNTSASSMHTTVTPSAAEFTEGGNDLRPECLWSQFYTLKQPSVPIDRTMLPVNWYISSEATASGLDDEDAGLEARNILKQLGPGLPWFPAKPEPLLPEPQTTAGNGAAASTEPTATAVTGDATNEGPSQSVDDALALLTAEGGLF
jgi:RAB protein geranylgeranyltransferase component A